MQSILELIEASEALRIYRDWELNRYVPLAHLEQSYDYDGNDEWPDQEQIIEYLEDDMINELNIHQYDVEAYMCRHIETFPNWADWDTAKLGYWGYE